MGGAGWGWEHRPGSNPRVPRGPGGRTGLDNIGISFKGGTDQLRRGQLAYPSINVSIKRELGCELAAWRCCRLRPSRGSEGRGRGLFPDGPTPKESDWLPGLDPHTSEGDDVTTNMKHHSDGG